MPVPKKRRTSATRGQRRSHDSLAAVQLMYEKNSKTNLPRRLHKAAALNMARVRKAS
ncbi:50S ribosomal protein L32 [Candidatus Saccharibacteria bacterium]|nr:50S ribosomal protein L32 [Candidatus Saccharibacteria bacterium]